MTNQMQQKITKSSASTLSFPLFSNLHHRLYKPEKLLGHLYTPLDDAIQEIEERRKNPELMRKISTYLQDDIPAHFSRSEPIFYLSRFLATPNYETLHVKEAIMNKPFKLVIGQDTKGKFSPNNELKWALAKLPVVKGLSHNEDEIIEYFTIVDFTNNQGRTFEEIDTHFGENIVDFHADLFKEACLSDIEVVDEATWIDRNYREDIYEQYKRILSLLCVHGIMFESYPSTEHEFLREIVYPAFRDVEKKFGVKPLIVEHLTEEDEIERNWNSYPSVFYKFIKLKFSNK